MLTFSHTHTQTQTHNHSQNHTNTESHIRNSWASFVCFCPKCRLLHNMFGFGASAINRIIWFNRFCIYFTMVWYVRYNDMHSSSRFRQCDTKFTKCHKSKSHLNTIVTFYRWMQSFYWFLLWIWCQSLWIRGKKREVNCKRKKARRSMGRRRKKTE